MTSTETADLDASTSEGDRPRSPRAVWWAAVCVILVALNLRPAVVVLAPLLPEITSSEGLSKTVAGTLTALPVVLFGLMAPVANLASARWPVERVLIAALAVLTAGSLVRLAPQTSAIFLGTALAGAGIAICNVLAPSLIKRDFGARTGLMMGLYSMALSGGAALAAGVTVPLAHQLDWTWRPASASWALLSVAAILAYLPLAGRRARPTSSPGARGASVSLWRNPLAWAVTAFMGLQSLNFYAVNAWLPTLLVSTGREVDTAGYLLALAQVCGTVASFTIPVLAFRLTHQRGLGVVVTSFMGIGMIGLWLAPGGALLWVAFIGAGQGACFSLAVTLVVLRTSQHSHTRALSGMSQTIGYVVAALGAPLVGVLRDLSGGWGLPLLVLSALLVPQTLAVVRAGRARFLVVDRPVDGIPQVGRR